MFEMINYIFYTISMPFAEPTAYILEMLYVLSGYFTEPNYGAAIILLAVFIRLLLYPFYKLQQKSFAAIYKLLSLHKERIRLQKKYFYDENRLLTEISFLHRSYNLQPTGDIIRGIIPLLIQIPIFIGVFSALKFYHFPEETHFLSLKNLSAPDDGVFIIILIFSLFILNRLSPLIQDSSSSSNKLGLGLDIYILFTSIASSMVIPSGLWLYIWASSVILWLQNQWLARQQKKDKTFSNIHIDLKNRGPVRQLPLN